MSLSVRSTALVRNRLVGLLALIIVACSTTPAPVVDRLPEGKPSSTKPTSTSKPTQKTPNKPVGDWRPDSHLVKKGDTLFSIGLEYGYDYKEIAQANNISAPYTIKVGQILKLSALKDKSTTDKPVSTKPSAQENSDGVTTYPINNENVNAGNNTGNTPSTAPTAVIALKEPKATREMYSDEAFKKPLPVVKPTDKPITKPTTDKPAAESKPSSEKSNAEKTSTDKPSADKPSTDSKPTSSADNLDWAWPTKGKVIANFNEAGNKGIDIAGAMGQSIEASAAGKVIYTGADLRGYGKLVIIKHNSQYLTVYAHNSVILVKEGQQVSRGQKIAEMGNTDSSTVKLHFEIRQQGKSVDPAKYLTAN